MQCGLIYAMELPIALSKVYEKMTLNDDISELLVDDKVLRLPSRRCLIFVKGDGHTWHGDYGTDLVSECIVEEITDFKIEVNEEWNTMLLERAQNLCDKYDVEFKKEDCEFGFYMIAITSEYC